MHRACFLILLLTFVPIVVLVHEYKTQMSMNKYSYTFLLEYLPVRYSATPQQESNRQTVYNFKDGFTSASIKDAFVDRIEQIRQCFNGEDWRICFIPASTQVKTITRYRELAEYLQSKTGIPCSVRTIKTLKDDCSGHINGKKNNPAENFSIDQDDVNHKNIILIDDVITRGNTFVYTSNKLMANGAKQVIGLFLAETINPDRQSCSA